MWTFEDQEKALAKGWGVFYNGNTRKLEIQRYGKAKKFSDDNNAADDYDFQEFLKALEHIEKQNNITNSR